MKNKNSLLLKIVFTIGMALVVVFASWRLTEYNFDQIAKPVNRLSQTYQPLELVNSVFKDVVVLDMLQRSFGAKISQDGLDSFYDHATKLSTSLDTLKVLMKSNGVQKDRVDSIKRLLAQKLVLFEEYLALSKAFKGDDSLEWQVGKLSNYIKKESFIAQPKSSKLLKEVRSVTTTSVANGDTLVEVKRNFWDRLTGRKREPIKVPATQTHYTQEARVVAIDSNVLRQENKALSDLSKTIQQLENDRTSRLKALNEKRIQLDLAGSQLFKQFILTLNDIEATAQLESGASNKEAVSIIDNGLNNNRILMVVFILMVTILAVLIFNDIGNSNKYRKELILAKEAADAASQTKQKFLSNMSHEIRTPLQSIIGYTELVQREEDPKSQKEFLKVVHQSSLHLLHIVNEILDFSKINSDKFSINAQRFNLQALTEEVKEIIVIQANKKNLSFNTPMNLLSDGVWLNGDPFRLKQILLNLLNNAVKFSDKGTVSLSVSQERVGDTFWTQFVVSDEGIGISKLDQQKIFNEFEQVPTDQLHYGSGLGLSIVKALVDLQGGTITVNSEPYQGATFIVRLPFIRGNVEEAGTDEQNSIEQEVAKMVWLIDDDPFILELCSEVLKLHQVPHQCFSSAKEMLATPAPSSLNYVVLDIRMPEYSGMELVKLLKNNLAERNSIQFVALTAQVLPEEVGDIYAAGFDRLIRKPFVTTTFLKALGVTPKMALISDEEAEDQIQALFLKETIADVIALKKHAEMVDKSVLAEIFHKLASRLSQMAYSDLGKRGRRLELQLRKDVYVAADIDAFIVDIENGIISKT